ncbi:endonuclease/exonuclease/phosphatase family protein [Marisediminicola senii]|uniref:endonuclease/exonuclease/phosphatase family protein n=1 Tax=Marisediminicola senii TaxID=2711233 RepID=UPI0013EC25B2|nr:endonuclease/exonuclease/phosphatase family protein [Marisediminicola senii]
MVETALVGRIDPPELHVMSYNIRRRMPHFGRRGPDSWRTRKPLMRRMLAREQPALLGVQEAMLDQSAFVREALGDDYREVGHGRDGHHRGERCPIFWDSSRLRLETWHQDALSDTPEVPGSRSWGNKDPRVLVSAVFTDRETGLHFLAMNTHLDHRSPGSRLRSAQLIRSRVAATSLPVVITGDFNADAHSIAHAALVEEGPLVDSWTAAGNRLTESWGTFPNYSPPVLGRKRIDWILTTPTVDVLSAAINVRRNPGGWPSDHTPIHAVVRLPEQ